MIISEVEKESLRKAKADVVRLRMLGEQEKDPIVQKEILAQLCAARFYHDIIEEGIMEEVRCNKQKQIFAKRVKRCVIAIIVIVLLTIVLSGCQTAKGITGDAGWILTELSDNIQTQEKLKNE